MAQAALKTCEICISAPGSHYCLDCCQYFCDNCKSMHKRQTISQNHKFESGSNVIPEVKSKCIEHNEGFIFVCTKCNVPVCTKCMAGKHNGHKVANITDTIAGLKKELRDDIKSKLEAASTILADTENGFKTFDVNVSITIKAIREEGTKLKAMIDRQVEQTIATLTEKAKLEKDKLSNIISDARKVVERCNELKQQNDRLQTAMEDVNLIKKLKDLKYESDKVKTGVVPEFPSVKFNNRTVTDKEISQLLGAYSISETKGKTTGVVTDIRQTEKEKHEDNGQKDSGQKQYLYRCFGCGTEQISQESPIGLFGQKTRNKNFFPKDKSEILL